MTSPWERVRAGVVVAALLLTAYNGIVEGFNATHFADTTGMKVATATQLLYGISAVTALAVMVPRRRLVFPILAVWGLAVVATGTLAPVVYAGSSLLRGAAIGVVTAGVVGLLLWAWPWRAARRST